MDIAHVLVWLLFGMMGICWFVLGQRDRAEQRVRELEAAQFTVWAVVYGNYSPYEVDSLWDTKAMARKRADKLGGDWRVKWWAVQQGIEENTHAAT